MRKGTISSGLRAVCVALAAVLLAGGGALAQAPARGANAHYAFVWTSATGHDGEGRPGVDFLAVIDADPASPAYGRLVTAVATDQVSMNAHHTEYVMPEGGMLFANDHNAGRSFLFDLRIPEQPKVAMSFRDVAGFSSPHSFARLPNGNVLATFMHSESHGAGHSADGHRVGGLVELGVDGTLVRAASAKDPAFPHAVLMQYGLAVLPAIDRVVSTNSSMRSVDRDGSTYQVWRLSDLKLLSTHQFDPGPQLVGHTDPEEPRVAPDGSVLVQTLSCGLQRITGLDTDRPQAKLVHQFPGGGCGVPTIVDNYLIQSVPNIHGVVVLDIRRPDRPVEVSRLSVSDTLNAHWTGWDARTGRLALTGYPPGDTRFYLLKLDRETGQVALDQAFKDKSGKLGFSFEPRSWPHGWTGAAVPHGVVFSR
ncbi:hypothetical protein [Phenylobacterium sp.]|uniref:hypothetical protein n=1 Tax=Phenylobacterium sp. TaxID=1871053 RepID=UPI002FCA2D92